MTPIRSISTLLTDLQTTLNGERVSMTTLVEAFHERGFGVLIFLFALPIALPFPVPPGINSAFALPLLILTAQLAIGRHTVWLPQFFLRRTIKRSTLNKTIDLSVPWLKKIEAIIRPRLGFLTHRAGSHVVGILGMIMASSIYIPIPLTNTVPGMGMCAMAIGLVMRDGLALSIGAIVGTLWSLMVYGIILFFGMEGVDMVKDFIKGFL